MTNVSANVVDRANQLQAITDDFVGGKINYQNFLPLLCSIALTDEEARHYLNVGIQRKDRQQAGQGGSGSSVPPQSGSGVREGNALESSATRAPEDATSAPVLGSGGNEAGQAGGLETARNDGGVDPALGAAREIQRALEAEGANNRFEGNEESLATLGRLLQSSSSIGANSFVGLPHIAKLTNSSGDPHLDETHRIRKLVSVDKVCEETIDVLQRQSIQDPLPRGIWKEIVLDKFVQFDKLYAALVNAYDWNDEPKDFAGEFTIIKKDHYGSKKPIRLESEWTRVFDAWRVGVGLVYPHREQELVDYREFIVELFRATLFQPAIPIKVDVDIREHYAKKPFKLNDRLLLNIPYMSHMYMCTSEASTSSRQNPGGKVPTPKRSQTTCEKWDLGKCTDTPCHFGRKHGVCSECHGSHPARENPSCFAKLKARRPNAASGPYGLAARISED
jgi:hypothetical protein